MRQVLIAIVLFILYLVLVYLPIKNNIKQATKGVNAQQLNENILSGCILGVEKRSLDAWKTSCLGLRDVGVDCVLPAETAIELADQGRQALTRCLTDANVN